jgi:hypothetical protein
MDKKEQKSNITILIIAHFPQLVKSYMAFDML